MDADKFRSVLRDVREGKNRLRMGQDKLGRPTVSKRTATTSGTAVNGQTIKNIEDGGIKDPGLFTVARIVEAMGMKLSVFFAEVEAQEQTSVSKNASRTNSDNYTSAISDKDRASPEAVPNGSGEVGDVSSGGDATIELDRLRADFNHLSGEIQDLKALVSVRKKVNRQASSPRRRKTSGSKKARGSHR